jgi:hypothetical protein
MPADLVDVLCLWQLPISSRQMCFCGVGVERHLQTLEIHDAGCYCRLFAEVQNSEMVSRLPAVLIVVVAIVHVEVVLT